MKVSYYELLGMMKEDKHPKKVKYNNNIYIWKGKNYSNYESEFLLNDLAEFLFETDMFDKNIEIIEEEPKKIEKLAVPDWNFLDSRIDYQKLLYYQNKNNIAFMNTFRKVIEELNELKGKGE